MYPTNDLYNDYYHDRTVFRACVWICERQAIQQLCDLLYTDTARQRDNLCLHSNLTGSSRVNRDRTQGDERRMGRWETITVQLLQHPYSVIQQSVFIQHSLSAAFFINVMTDYYCFNHRRNRFIIHNRLYFAPLVRKCIFTHRLTYLKSKGIETEVDNGRDGWMLSREMAEDLRQFGQHANEEVGEFCWSAAAVRECFALFRQWRGNRRTYLKSSDFCKRHHPLSSKQQPGLKVFDVSTQQNDSIINVWSRYAGHGCSDIFVSKTIYVLSIIYSASVLLAMQTAVIVRGILSVRPSVTFRCFVHRNEETIVRFSASGRKIILVSEKVNNFIRIFAGYYPQQRRLKWSPHR